MNTLVWLGPCNASSQKFLDLIRSESFQQKNNIIFFEIPHYKEGESNKIPPHNLLLAESHAILTYALQDFPTSHQVLFCRTIELSQLIHDGLRPLNRYFFLTDKQTQVDLQTLIHSFNYITTTVKNKPHYQSTLPSMRNSLAVLNKIAEDQINELQNFILADEERKHQFRSQIRLIRNLSMSRDIEEIAQVLWDDLKSNENIKSIFFLSMSKVGILNQIHYRNGKFYFELIRQTTATQKEFLKSINHQIQRDEIYNLSLAQMESLSFLIKKTLRKTLATPLFDFHFETQLILFLEVENNWTPPNTFREQISERLSFVRLTLEKHFLQESMRSKTHLWTSTFDDFNDPLAISDSDNHLIRFNQKFQQAFKGELKNPALGEKQTLPDFIKNRVEFSSTNGSFEVGVQNKIYRVSTYPIKGTSTTRSAHIIHAVDISTERALYSRITQSEKMVAIGQLAGNLSEALTRPLKEISRLASLYMPQPTISATAHQDLNEINKASLRSLKIIDDFEKFSHGTIVKTSLYAESIIEKTIPLIKAIIHGHRFQMRLSESRHLIFASLSLMQQVLYNLLRNAHQSMSQPGIIEISTETKELKSHSNKFRLGVIIKIIDSGRGVPETLRSMLFQPFISSKGNDGTGLGLNIVKQIVESHDGVVGYEPNFGGGSIFWVWLPMSENEVTEE